MCAGIIQTRMPKPTPRWLVILLLTAMATLPVAGNVTSVAMVSHPRPAACHQHGSSVPHPQPVSYRCCQSGHDTAILQRSSVSHLNSFDLAAPSDRSHIFLPTVPLQNPRNLTTSSPDPPDLISLRV